MGTVTFLKMSLRDPLTVNVRSQEKRTLLSLLTQLNLFDACTCGQGRCGQCAVKVVLNSHGHTPRPVRLSHQEKSVLFKAGKLTREQYEADAVLASPALWRLACQYVVRYEEILVAV
jgi:ferredoxin